MRKLVKKLVSGCAAILVTALTTVPADAYNFGKHIPGTAANKCNKNKSEEACGNSTNSRGEPNCTWVQKLDRHGQPSRHGGGKCMDNKSHARKAAKYGGGSMSGESY